MNTAADIKTKKDVSSNVKSIAEKDVGKKRKTATEAPPVPDEKKLPSIVKSPKIQQPKVTLREQSRPAENITAQTLSDEKSESKSETKTPEEKIKIDKKILSGRCAAV